MAKFLFWLKCVYYFRRTPRGMDRFFSDLLLSLDEFEPTKVLDYVATTNGGSHIYLQHETEPDVALNYSMGLGLSIACEVVVDPLPEPFVMQKWAPLYSRSTQLLLGSPFWVSIVRRLLALELKSKVKPLPLSRILESK